MKITNIKELEELKNAKRKELNIRENVNYKGKEKHILICHGTGCTSSKSPEILKEFNNLIKKNGLKNVRTVMTGCFGICSKGPVVIVRPDDTFYSNVKVEDCKEIIEKHIIEGSPVERLLCKDIDGKKANKLDDLNFYKKQKRIALKNCGNINPEDIEEYIAFEGYEALGKVLMQMSQDEVIKEITESGLRGRGGAGFSTGKKWSFVKQEEGKQKYIVCNADEGDPGAFMDRSILEGDPHSVIEAMEIAGYACRSKQRIYLC